MKKLLLLPIVLILMVFSLYHEDVGGRNNIEQDQKNRHQEIQIEEEILEIFTSQNEIKEVEASIGSTEKKFSVKIKGDRKVLKDNSVILTADVENAQRLERCNYFWYEDAKLIDMGETLQKRFAKGDHNITLKVKDVNGVEKNSTILLSAYDYYSIKRFNYDPYYGNLLYVETIITNHKGYNVVYDNGNFSKEVSKYDENDKLIEKIVDYYKYPDESSKTSYSYNDDGQILVRQTFNHMGESVYYALHIYDDKGTLTDIQYGTNEDDVKARNVDETEIIYYSTADLNETQAVQRLNENGQVVYEEQDYGDFKVINKNIYDDNYRLVKEIRRSESTISSRETVREYDEKGNPINSEYKRYYNLNDAEVYCHYATASTFTDSGMSKTEVSTVLGGNCPYVDEVKREFTYDDELNVANVKAIFDGDKEASFNTLVIKRTYTNEIEM